MQATSESQSTKNVQAAHLVDALDGADVLRHAQAAVDAVSGQASVGQRLVDARHLAPGQRIVLLAKKVQAVLPGEESEGDGANRIQVDAARRRPLCRVDHLRRRVADRTPARTCRHMRQSCLSCAAGYLGAVISAMQCTGVPLIV